MRRAIALARGQKGRTTPNPAVGCVLVKDDRVIGEGATQDGGRPHAEDMALRQAGVLAEGATAYVTLEPCGARSVPGTSCTDLLISAGVAKVIIACRDPSPFAAGSGLERLAEAGIEVQLGLLADEASGLYDQ